MTNARYSSGCEEMRTKLEAYSRQSVYSVPEASEVGSGITIRADLSTGFPPIATREHHKNHQVREGDKIQPQAHNPKMSEITREELQSTLSGIEDRMDKRIDRMEKSTELRAEEFRRELALRDEALRREIEIRREAFLAEQAIRDKALDERFSGFLATQAERDNALTVKYEAIGERLTAISGEMSEIRSSTRNWGMWVVGTVLASAFAVWLGISQFNSSIVANALTGFTLGSDAGTKQTQMSKDIEQLKQNQAKPPAAPENITAPPKGQ